MGHKTLSLTVAIQGGGTSTLEDLRIISSLLQEDTGINLIPVSEDDTCIRLEWLKAGKIDLMYEDSNSVSLLECVSPNMAMQKRGPFQIRIVASAHSGAVGIMVPGDSKISGIQDIDCGTRFAVPTGTNEMLFALLNWIIDDTQTFMTEWPITVAPFQTWEESQRSISEGTADATLAAPENPIVKELASRPPGIRFLDMSLGKSQDSLNRFHHFIPHGQLIPAPHHGVKEIWDVTSWVGTACLWCVNDFEVETAYNLTKWFDKNYYRFKDSGNKLKNYTREALRQTIDSALAPIHDGTIKYLKEIGEWYSRDELRQQYNEELISRYCTAWEEALSCAKRQHIKADPENKLWLELWENYKKVIAIPKIRPISDIHLV